MLSFADIVSANYCLLYKVLRKTTCSRKSLERHYGTAILSKCMKSPLSSRVLQDCEKGVSFDTILAFVKEVSFVVDKEYNRGNKLEFYKEECLYEVET